MSFWVQNQTGFQQKVLVENRANQAFDNGLPLVKEEILNHEVSSDLTVYAE